MHYCRNQQSDLWNQDLDEFLAEFDKFLLRDEQERESLASNGRKIDKEKSQGYCYQRPAKQ